MIEAIGWSIRTTSELTSEGVWKIKERLRAGQYRAWKAGRRTIVDPASVREVWANLPIAKFAPPRRNTRTAQAENQQP
jgi:hypothetical protein